MGESDGGWGLLETDDERATWDSYDYVPEWGENAALDSFLKLKNLDPAALSRIGARMSAPMVIAFAFDGGIKYRNIINGKRWSTGGATFNKLRIVQGTSRDACLICEGETDAARLTMLYDADVAIMPAGAKAWKDTYTEQVEHYTRVFVALDNDSAGEAGWQKVHAAVPHAVRWRPPDPANDWCALDGDPPPLLTPEEVEKLATRVLVPLSELIVMDTPDIISWYEDAVLPVSGTMIIHATFKSFKTWVALDLAASLAQGTAWAGFTNLGGPARVAYLNFEIPWAYYQERVRRFNDAATEPELLGSNYYGYEPLTRPRLVAGNEESENKMMKTLMDGGIEVVVIDPIRRTLGFANPNAEDEVRRLLYFVERLNDSGMTVVMVHHDNKESDKHGGGDPSGMTGSGAWAGDPDTIVTLSRPAGESRDSTKRNVGFLMRNAPSAHGKGIEIVNDGSPVKWQNETWVEELDPDQPSTHKGALRAS